MSAASSADYATDSFFLALILRADTCERTHIEEIWKEVLSQSFLAFLGQILSFRTVVFGSYIMTLLQPFIGLLHSTPKFGQDINYNVGALNNVEYDTFLDKKQNHGDTLYLLSEVADMIGIQVQSPDFPRCKAAKVWANSSDTSVVKIQRIHALLRNSLKRCLMRIGLITLLENTYQVNLQVSIFNMFRFIVVQDHETEEYHRISKLQNQTTISILIAYFMTCLRFSEAWQNCAFANETFACVDEVLDATREDDTEGSLTPDTIAEIKAEQMSIRCWKYFLILSCVTHLLGMTYAGVKYVMGFHCESSLWNLSGCVVVRKDLFRTSN
jgi:hypothetical protein